VVAYIPLYAISQLILFQFRSSEPVLALGLHQAQWTALAILLVVSPIVYVVWRRTSGASTQPAVAQAQPEEQATPHPETVVAATSADERTPRSRA
jgi:uncharacterized membrane protein